MKNMTFLAGSELVLYESDWSNRHEIKTGGQTIVASPPPTVTILEDGSPSTKITVADIIVNGAGTKVQFKLSDVSAVDEDVLHVQVTVTLSGGAEIPDCGVLIVSGC